MIGTNQTRIGNEAKSVVQAAESAAAQSASSAQQQAEAIASDLTAQSIANSTTTTSSSTSSIGLASNSQSSGSGVAVLAATQTTVGKVDVLKSPTQATSTEINTQGTSSFTINALIQPAPINTPVATASTANQSSQYELFTLRSPSTEIEAPQLEGIKIGSRSALMDAIEQQQPVQPASTPVQSTSVVNRNVQPNELAAGVDINNIARQPAGYQAYSVAMPDVAFYAPKEIYKNQVNVDNVRLLRGLGSDRLHQELVNLQYK